MKRRSNLIGGAGILPVLQRQARCLSHRSVSPVGMCPRGQKVKTFGTCPRAMEKPPSRLVVIDADGVLCLANVLEHAVECRLDLFQIGAS